MDGQRSFGRRGAKQTREDMELIETLWKQDVDLGVSYDLFSGGKSSGSDKGDGPTLAADDIERLKQQTLCSTTGYKGDDEEGSIIDEPFNPWAGLAYTVDGETGEYILKDPLADDLNTNPVTGLSDEAPSALIDLPEFSLEEALQLVGLDEDPSDISNEDTSPEEEKKEEEEEKSPSSETASGEAAASAASPETEKDAAAEAETPAEVPDGTDEELGVLGEMIQTAQFHHPAPRPFQAVEVEVGVSPTPAEEWECCLPGGGSSGRSGKGKSGC